MLRFRFLGFPVEVQLLRLIQEALSNVRKHAAAHRVQIRFSVTDTLVEVIIEDDGRGFDPTLAQQTNRFGLQAMGERAALHDAPLVLVCGLLATKDARAFFAHFTDLAARIVAVPVSGDHYGRAPADVAEASRDLGLFASEAPSIEEAFTRIVREHWRAPPRILICGSLYLAGEALALNGSTLD